MIRFATKLTLTITAAVIATTALGTERPNVVIIYGDDVGYADVGAYGAKKIPTPNLDQLAKEGLVFTDGHCSAATCSPSRFSLLTGVLGFRHGVRILPPNARLTIPTDILTLPKVFQRAGYTTGVVGKWHLGLGEKGEEVDWNGEVKPGPLEVGFDHSFLLPSTNDRVPCVYLENYRVVNLDPKDPLHVGNRVGPNPKSTVYPDGKTDREAMTYYQSSHGHNSSVINGIGRIGYMAGGKSALWNDETMADEFVNRTRDFIADHKDKPFFLYFSSQDIHVPRAPHPRFHGKSKLTYRGDAMVQLDWCAGEIMKMLDEHGLAENTIVIFSSDNGPVYDDGYQDGTTIKPRDGEVDRGHDGSGPYRGGKYQIYEGGTRVPLIVRWPARVKPGKSSALISQLDFIASFAAMFDIELPDSAAMDSQNVLPALLGQDPAGNTFIVEEAGGLALRKGPWKLIAGKKTTKKPGGQLYNLESDIGEQVDVADKHPELVAEMSAILAKIREKGLRHQ
jgi:arylsulfatase A